MVHSINTSLGMRLHSINTSLGMRLHSINTSLGMRLHSINTSPGMRLHSINTSPGMRLHSINTSPGMRLLKFLESSIMQYCMYTYSTRYTCVPIPEQNCNLAVKCAHKQIYSVIHNHNKCRVKKTTT